MLTKQRRTTNIFKMSNIMKIDGNLGEGGGQVLRISLTISALFGIPVEINNIRAGRPKPGLAAQHLKGLELAKEMCYAEVKGAHLGSTCVEFRPGKLQSQKQTFLADTGTAGCICLLSQVALPCALFTPTSNTVKLILKGGTNVPMGPQIEYLTKVLKPILNKFGVNFDSSVVRRGYFPRGGGEFHMSIVPVRAVEAVEILDPGNPVKIAGWSFVAGAVPIHEAQKMSSNAKTTISQSLGNRDISVPPMNISVYKEEKNMAMGHGSGINLVCETSSGCVFGGSGLGSKKEKQSPGVVAANGILRPILSRSCIDEYAQDQLIIFMALAKGRSRVLIGEDTLTSHTETAIKVAEILLADKGLRFNLTRQNENSGPFVLECDGCGLINDFMKT